MEKITEEMTMINIKMPIPKKVNSFLFIVIFLLLGKYFSFD